MNDTPDPKNPKEGDHFIGAYGDELIITAVGRQSVLWVYADDTRTDTEVADTREWVAKHWKPVPTTPIVNGRTTLFEYDLRGDRYLTTSTTVVRNSATGRKIVLIPRHGGDWDGYYDALHDERESGVWYEAK